MGKTRTKPSTKTDHAGLSRDELLRLYRVIYASRRTDDKEIQLKRQNRAFFQISGVGHEAICAAAARDGPSRAGDDWFYHLLPRPRARSRRRRDALRDAAAGGRARRTTPRRAAGRCLSHWGNKELNGWSATSSPIGTQYLNAVGVAPRRGIKKHRRSRWLMRDAGSSHAFARSDEIVLVTGGDGSTSEGEFWEALSTACVLELPVVFLIEDNGYAISVPREVQTPQDIDRARPSRVSSRFEGPRVRRLRSRRVLGDERRRSATRGPARAPPSCMRPLHPSLQPLHVRRRAALPAASEEIDEQLERDPARATFPERLIRSRASRRRRSSRRSANDVDRRDRGGHRSRARRPPWPDKTREEVELFVFSPDIDPTGRSFEAEPSFERRNPPR